MPSAYEVRNDKSRVPRRPRPRSLLLNGAHPPCRAVAFLSAQVRLEPRITYECVAYLVDPEAPPVAALLRGSREC
eukprot:scaffold7214_cov410-Prasinococcus_capsulatus_cf.AAC.14